MPVSTASMWRRSESDSVHSHRRFQASSREKGSDMAVTLARLSAQPSELSTGPVPERLMEKFVIEGGVPLSGTVVPAGNKNAALPVLAASLLTEEEVVVGNVPRIRDVDSMLGLLEDLGVSVSWRDEHELSLRADNLRGTDLDEELA